MDTRKQKCRRPWENENLAGRAVEEVAPLQPLKKEAEGEGSMEELDPFKEEVKNGGGVVVVVVLDGLLLLLVVVVVVVVVVMGGKEGE